MSARRAVFTSITGGYETLNETPVEVDTGVDFLCFTDDPGVVSDRWTVIVVPRWFPSDPMRSQRVTKIVGHPALDSYDETLYIDNTVRLKVDPGVILDEWLEHHDLAIPLHSFRSSVLAEFEAVRGVRLDTSERLDEQLDHYSRDYPDVLKQPPHWNGMIARRSTGAVRHAMEIWLTHVLRYARRDQLSLNVALAVAGLPHESVVLDNRASAIHDWPIDVGRTSGPAFVWPDRAAELSAQLDEEIVRFAALEKQVSSHHAVDQQHVADLSAQLALLQHEIAELRSSTSWRATAPLRAVMSARRRLTREHPKG
ncbi:MAG TPA: DUF616 domain-containing protein [Rhodoglobus sp.]|nr:DUF616 domain-containing protein [Rhodoglobus sp.]